MHPQKIMIPMQTERISELVPSITITKRFIRPELCPQVPTTKCKMVEDVSLN